MESMEQQGRANAVRGAWGEDVAAQYLRTRGWRIVGRNVRPCKNDRRCEIDLVMRDEERRIVFVEVKTHLRKSPREGRLARIDRRKKLVLLRACANWVMRNRWHGNFRFDVVEVYGSPAGETPPPQALYKNAAVPGRSHFCRVLCVFFCCKEDISRL